MIDFSDIGKYHENNRIEAKLALGGLPHSIWETYSAFANTLGGIILLGVEESRDKNLRPVDLPDPDRLVSEFLALLNNPRKASVNILSEQDVRIEIAGGNRIIVISVPRAQRCDRPVYIDGDPFTGSYRRNGEGDYRCSKPEIEGMLRDAGLQSQDMRILGEVSQDALEPGTVNRYRDRLLRVRTGRVWSELPDAELLFRLGALGRGGDGRLHPSAAGLLLFGENREILRQFPTFRLTYGEADESPVSYPNVYDGYCGIGERLSGIGDAASREALLEALTNCLLNTDYQTPGGISVIRGEDGIRFSNPGSFRIDVDTAKSGGISDPRNGGLTRLLHPVGIGKGGGNGIPGICALWAKRGLSEPEFTESFAPERTTLFLPAGSREDGARGGSLRTDAYRNLLISALTERAVAGSRELSDALGISLPRVRRLLTGLVRDGIAVRRGKGRATVYQLRA